MSNEQSVSLRERPGRQAMLTSTAWIPEGDVRLAEWIDCGRRLGVLGRGVAWWIGDWLLYGNTHYGEKYARAARITGYDIQSLMNMSYVASRFTADRRRTSLSWSHHAEIAALPPAEQDRWLDLAEAERLSVRSLRLEVRTARRSLNSQSAVAENRSKRATTSTIGKEPRGVVCPRCMHIIEVAREDSTTAPRGSDGDGR